MMSNKDVQGTDNIPLAIWLYMVRFSQRVVNTSDVDLKKHDITGPQLELLSKVYHSEGMAQQEIADQLMVTKGNISQLIEKLNQKDLISVKKTGRASKIFITKKGVDLVERMAPLHEAFIKGHFKALTEEEQQQLFALMQKLFG